MRIITGLLKGRLLDVPKSADIRPTTDRTKEGLFSVIEAYRYLMDSRVLDLFAGSGSLGFEAISRGAGNVLFVDDNHHATRHIEKTAAEFEVSDQVRTATVSVEDFLKGPAIPYDFIFADPPYRLPIVDQLPSLVLGNGWLQPDGWFLMEHHKRTHFDNHPHFFKSKHYGKTIVSIFTLEA